MRDYGRIHTRFWEQPEIAALAVESRLMALYLLTCQHSNMIGCYRLSAGYAMDDLKLSLEAINGAFVELEGAEFLHRCVCTGWVLIPKYLKYNPIENGNQAKAAIKLIDKVPSQTAFIPALRASIQQFGGSYVSVLLSADLFSGAVVGESGVCHQESGKAESSRGPAHSPADDSARMSPAHSPAAKGCDESVSDDDNTATEGHPKGYPKGYPKGLGKGHPKGYPNQEQEQEQERESARGARLTLSALPDDWRAWAKAQRADLDVDRVWDCFADYWRAKPGKDGVKSDWLATWRNWIRREVGTQPAAPSGSAARQINLRELVS